MYGLELAAQIDPGEFGDVRGRRGPDRADVFWNPDPPYRGISVYIHQYALVDVGDAIMKVDPFYDILEKRTETKS